MLKNKNVLIFKFPYSSLYGGGEKHTLELVENLQKRGWQFYLISSCPILLQEFSKRHWPCEKAWAGYEPVTFWSLFIFLFAWPAVFINLFRLLVACKYKKKISIIYCLSLTEKILLTLPARLIGLKVIWMEHVLIGRWLTASPLKYLYALLSRLACVICVVSAIKNQLRSLGVPDKNIEIIYNGIDVNKFKPKTSSQVKTPGKFVVGFLGRLSAEKGVKYLILAIGKIKSIIPNISLIIIGEGEQKSSLKMLIKDRGIENKVMFVGFQREVEKWLSDIDCLVLPAIEESFGLAAAEALAMEKPVIVTRVGGLAEVVGEQAYFIEPHHATGIADALINICTNYPEACAKAKLGRQRIVSLFSLEIMIDRYDKVLASLL